VRNRLFNKEGGAYSAEFASYGLLGREAAYCGRDLPTFRWNLLASSNLVEIYRRLEARSVSRFKYHEYVGSTVQKSGENLS